MNEDVKTGPFAVPQHKQFYAGAIAGAIGGIIGGIIIVRVGVIFGAIVTAILVGSLFLSSVSIMAARAKTSSPSEES